jgi:hypothetical protein
VQQLWLGLAPDHSAARPATRRTGTASPDARWIDPACRELFLPGLLAGALPTTVEAQRGKALINALTDDDLEHLITLAELV